MWNFYSLYFEKNKYIPVIKNGIKIEVRNNVAYLDGVFSYRLFTKPQEYNIEETNLDKLFCLYPNNIPWIAKENDGSFYLYKGSIDRYSLNLKFDIDENICYISIEIPKEGNVSINEGRVITRLFRDDNQVCILEVKKDATIVIEKEDLVTILEWNGEKFISR